MSGPRKIGACGLTLALSLWMTGMAASAELLVDGVPVPDDIAIAAAPAGLSGPAGGFLGGWVGAWDDALKHILVVEEVRADGAARVVFAVGDNPAFGIAKAYRRLDATLSGDTLAIFGAAFSARYVLEG